MVAFKVGDRVRLAKMIATYCGNVGDVGYITKEDADSSQHYKVQFEHDSWWCYVDQLELIPKFNAGDKVRVKPLAKFAHAEARRSGQVGVVRSPPDAIGDVLVDFASTADYAWFTPDEIEILVDKPTTVQITITKGILSIKGTSYTIVLCAAGRAALGVPDNCEVEATFVVKEKVRKFKVGDRVATSVETVAGYDGEHVNLTNGHCYRERDLQKVTV